MSQTEDGSAWTLVTSIVEIAERYSCQLAEARAEAHRLIDAQFDRRAAEQELLLVQLQREFEGASQH